MEQQQKPQYTLQEKIAYYRNEILECTKRLAYCTRRLAALYEQEAEQIRSNIRDAVKNEQKGA